MVKFMGLWGSLVYASIEVPESTVAALKARKRIAWKIREDLKGVLSEDVPIADIAEFVTPIRITPKMELTADEIVAILNEKVGQ